VVLLVLLLFALMLVPEVPRLVQRRQWPELAAFMALWAAGLACRCSSPSTLMSAT